MLRRNFIFLKFMLIRRFSESRLALKSKALRLVHARVVKMAQLP